MSSPQCAIPNTSSAKHIHTVQLHEYGICHGNCECETKNFTNSVFTLQPFLSWPTTTHGLNFLASAAAALSAQQQSHADVISFANAPTSNMQKVTHSVSAILGVSQKENVADTTKEPPSPHAFKPLKRQPFAVLKQ
jgi:hypothetical protein